MALQGKDRVQEDVCMVVDLGADLVYVEARAYVSSVSCTQNLKQKCLVCLIWAQ